MKNLVSKLRKEYPEVTFASGDRFYWSSDKQQINYVEQLMSTKHGKWTILHELGHAISCHKQYSYDLELLKMEVTAWAIAQKLAKKYKITIDNDHIQDCLDTYRDWVHLRSICPRCASIGIQPSHYQYYCFNCEHEWKVTKSRLSRPYRLSITA